MGAFYTLFQGVGVTGGAVLTLTHSLGFAPASLVARPIVRQALLTATTWPQIVSLGTNAVGVQLNGAGTLVTCDVEVQLIHSVIA